MTNEIQDLKEIVQDADIEDKDLLLQALENIEKPVPADFVFDPSIENDINCEWITSEMLDELRNIPPSEGKE